MVCGVGGDGRDEVLCGQGGEGRVEQQTSGRLVQGGVPWGGSW